MSDTNEFRFSVDPSLSNPSSEQQFAATILKDPVRIAQLRNRAPHLRLQTREDVVTALRALGEEKAHRITTGARKAVSGVIRQEGTTL